MITANVWERVVHIVCGAASETGFTIDHGGVPYLITARHVVDGSDPIQIRVRGSVVSVNSVRLSIPIADADIAVFRLDREITPSGLPLPIGSDGMVFGQDGYFLGFPLGLRFDIGPEYLPLVKRCTPSALSRIGGRSVLLLDGWNNPGFSGSPVVFRQVSSLGTQVSEPTERP